MYDPLIFNFDFTVKEKILRYSAFILTFITIIILFMHNFSLSIFIILVPLIGILFLLFPRFGYISLLEIESGNLKYLIYHKSTLIRKIFKPKEKSISLFTFERLEIIHKGIFTLSSEIIFHLKPKKIKFSFRPLVLINKELQSLQSIDSSMDLKRTSINANLVWLAEHFYYSYNIDDVSIDINEDINYLLLVNVVIFVILVIQLLF